MLGWKTSQHICLKKCLEFAVRQFILWEIETESGQQFRPLINRRCLKRRYQMNGLTIYVFRKSPMTYAHRQFGLQDADF